MQIARIHHGVHLIMRTISKAFPATVTADQLGVYTSAPYTHLRPVLATRPRKPPVPIRRGHVF